MNKISGKSLYIQGQQYLIQQNILGTGGFGSVFPIKNVSTGEMYAVKMVHCKNEGAKKTIINEIEKLSQLPFSPYIVSIRPYNIYSNNYYYMIMDYCSEGSLDKQIEESLLTNKKISQKKIKKLIYDITQGYLLLQEKKILHLDIKPQNILKKRGCYALADFGFAVYDNNNMQSRSGTLHYLSPERLLSGHIVNPADDMFAFGITLCQYSNRYKHPYFYRLMPESVQGIYNVLMSNIKPKFQENLSKQIKQLLNWMIKINPEERLTWKELQQILKKDKFFEQQMKNSFQFSIMQPKFESQQLIKGLAMKTQINIDVINKQEQNNRELIQQLYEKYRQCLDKKIKLCIYLAKIIDAIQLHKYLNPSFKLTELNTIQHMIMDYMKILLQTPLTNQDLKLNTKIMMAQKIEINIQKIQNQYNNILSIKNKIKQFKKRILKCDYLSSKILNQIKQDGKKIVQKIFNDISISSHKQIIENNRSTYLWKLLLYNFEIFLKKIVDNQNLDQKLQLIDQIGNFNIFQKNYNNDSLSQKINKYICSGEFFIQIQNEEELIQQLIDPSEIKLFNNVGKYAGLY